MLRIHWTEYETGNEKGRLGNLILRVRTDRREQGNPRMTCLEALSKWKTEQGLTEGAIKQNLLRTTRDG